MVIVLFCLKHFVDVEPDSYLYLLEDLIIYVNRTVDESFSLFQMPEVKTNVFSIVSMVVL